MQTARTAADQDAQVAKQAKQQIAFSAKRSTTHSMPDKRPAKMAANVAKDRAEEAAAAKSNAKVLAALPKTKAVAPTLAKGSGALVGVAAGAMDGQPHTKLAVAQARARLLAEQRGEADAVLAKLVREEKATPKLVQGTAFPTAKAAALRRAEVRKLIEFGAAKPKADPTAPKAAKAAPKAKAPAAPKATADRAYAKGPNAYSGAAGSWTAYMVELALRFKSTDAAKAAHAKGGQFPGKALDFKWMADTKGFIAWK